MAKIVYLLCALTSLLCAHLLYRNYARQRGRLLLWSSVCFLCLGFSNIMLFVDLIILPDTDLSMARDTTTLAGIGTLIYGLIWETK